MNTTPMNASQNSPQGGAPKLENLESLYQQYGIDPSATYKQEGRNLTPRQYLQQIVSETLIGRQASLNRDDDQRKTIAQLVRNLNKASLLSEQLEEAQAELNRLSKLAAQAHTDNATHAMRNVGKPGADSGMHSASPYDRQIKQLGDNINHIQADMRELVPNTAVLGPTGAGKSSLCRALAEIYVAYGLIDNFIYMTNPSAGYVGQTSDRIDQICNRVTQNNTKLGLVIIEEAGSTLNSGFAGDIMGELLKRLDGNDYTTGKPSLLRGMLNCYEEQYDALDASNEGFRHRISKVIHVPAPSPEQMLGVTTGKLAQSAIKPDATQMDAVKKALLTQLSAGHAAGRGFGNFRGAEKFAKEIQETYETRLAQDGSASVYQQIEREILRDTGKSYLEKKAVSDLLKQAYHRARPLTVQDIPTLQVQENKADPSKSKIMFSPPPHDQVEPVDQAKLEATIRAELKELVSHAAMPVGTPRSKEIASAKVPVKSDIKVVDLKSPAAPKAAKPEKPAGFWGGGRVKPAGDPSRTGAGPKIV